LSVVQRKDSEVEIDLREGLEAAERLPTPVIPNSHSLGSLRQSVASCEMVSQDGNLDNKSDSFFEKIT